MGWEDVVIGWVSVTSEKGQQAWPDNSELPTLWQWLNTLSGSHSRKMFKNTPNMFSYSVFSPSLMSRRAGRLSPQYLSAQSPLLALQLGKL